MNERANELFCTREYTTGSNMPVTKCRPRDQIESERRAAQEIINRAQMSGTGTKASTGNR